jgi:hypothetical protein
MCQAFHDFCTFGILNTTTSVHVSIVYISHPKYLWNVICLVGYLKAHPLSCLAWWDWLLTRWPPKASSLTFLCVSTWLFSNLYRMQSHMALVSLDSNICVFVQLSEEHHCNICGYVDICSSHFVWFRILKYAMTFDQCFFYSPVAPVCYAHLAAAQMSQFMKFEEFADTSSGSGIPSSTATVPELPRLHADVCSSMFFCWAGFSRSVVQQGLTLSVWRNLVLDRWQ